MRSSLRHEKAVGAIGTAFVCLRGVQSKGGLCSCRPLRSPVSARGLVSEHDSCFLGSHHRYTQTARTDGGHVADAGRRLAPPDRVRPTYNRLLGWTYSTRAVACRGAARRAGCARPVRTPSGRGRPLRSPPLRARRGRARASASAGRYRRGLVGALDGVIAGAGGGLGARRPAVELPAARAVLVVALEVPAGAGGHASNRSATADRWSAAAAVGIADAARGRRGGGGGGGRRRKRAHLRGGLPGRISSQRTGSGKGRGRPRRAGERRVRGSNVSGKQPGDGSEGRGGAVLRRLRRR